MIAWKQNKFCGAIEYLTFTEATLVAPLTLLVLLYLPTLLYVVLCSLTFYGWREWSGCVLDDPVHFIFPIFTNISLYKSRRAVKERPKVDEEMREIKHERADNSDKTISDPSNENKAKIENEILSQEHPHNSQTNSNCDEEDEDLQV